MSFRPGARLDPGAVTDVRGRRVGGTGLALGGGGLGLVAVIVYMLLGGNPGDLAQTQPGVQPDSGNQNLQEECRTGADANERQDCRIVGFVNSVEAYWESAVPSGDYVHAETFIFSDQISTGCGTATSAVGPFYCPLDQSVYFDLGFFSELQRRFGAQGGPLAEGYVVAHEYGHHVQNLMGLLRPGEGGSGAESRAVRTELMADCFAGAWAGNAAETGFLEALTREQIAQALDAAAAVGDDRIQERMQGQVNPEAWTHGSSEQRQTWFIRGYESQDPNACDTFNQDI
jgi:predicted metalloprotease